jgi:flagellar hook-associated protein 3 FlgL
MRISTAGSYAAGIGTMQKRQEELVEAQERLTSGKRVMRASDDPTAAARAERALAIQARSQADQRAVDASRSAMTLVESALGDALGLMQDAREALVSAGNGTYSAAERAGVAQQLRNLRQQLLAVANRDDGAGVHLFAGQGSASPPFLDAAGGVAFAGTPGEVKAADGEPLPLAFDGAAVWMSAPRGNGVFETRVINSAGTGWIDTGRVSDPSALTGSTYTLAFTASAAGTTYSIFRDGVPTALSNLPFAEGTDITVDGMTARVTGRPADGDTFELAPSTPDLSVFQALDSAIAGLTDANASQSAIRQSVGFGLRDLDATMARVQAARSRAGDALNHIDGATDRLAATQLTAQTDRSAAEDLDLVQALSEFQSQQSGYEAALKTYANVQRLSLFQYIGS